MEADRARAPAERLARGQRGAALISPEVSTAPTSPIAAQSGDPA
jgi:hypothetical protein